MSLQVWLPLTGHLNNQGLSNVTVTNNGATVDNNGKIGKCYSFDGTNDRIYANNVSLSNSEMTAACWVNFLATPATNTYPYIVSLGYNNTTYGAQQQIGISWWNTSSSNTVHICANGSELDTSFVPTLNTWYHLCFTYKGSSSKLYVNGSLYYTGTNANTPQTRPNLCIGARSDNAAGAGTGYKYPFNGKLNDVRIYDHALSEKEIKELSKGLVLHYPLSQGSTNLYDFESIANKWTADGATLANTTDANYGNVLKLTLGSSLSSGHRAYRSVSNLWTSGQIYTVSFLAKASKTVDCDMSRSLTNFTSHFTLTTEWKRYIGQINCTETATGGTLSFRVNTTSCDVYFTQVKLELGEIATPYTPGPGDSHYNAMGYNSTTEYDVSGLLYNGTTTGAALTYNSDTPRYNVCSHFVGTNYIYLTSPSAEAVSISLWVKWDSIPSGQSVVFMDYKSRIGFGLMSTGILCGSVSGSYYTFSKANIQANKWYHFVIVSPNGATNTTRKLYINGVEQTATSNTSQWSYTIDQLQIGKRSTTSDGFVGCISDFRMYATALSAEDIAELYNTAASLANNGTLFAYSFVEV